MNKKMICGVLLTVVGLVYSAFCFIEAVLHPGTYNGIGGLRGALLCSDTLLPFVLSTAVMWIGLLLCFIEAYRKH